MNPNPTAPAQLVEQARLALAQAEERLAAATQKVADADADVAKAEQRIRATDPDAKNALATLKELRIALAAEQDRRDLLAQRVDEARRERANAEATLADAQRAEALARAIALDGATRTAVADLTATIATARESILAAYTRVFDLSTQWRAARIEAGQPGADTHPAATAWAVDRDDPRAFERIVTTGRTLIEDELRRARESVQADRDTARRKFHDRARVLAGPRRDGEHPMHHDSRVAAIAAALERGEDPEPSLFSPVILPTMPLPRDAAQTDYDSLNDLN